MSTLSFTQALLQAEAQARSTLAPELHERLTAAVALVQDGRVFQATDGTWQVDSATRQGLVHSVNGICSCEDAHFQAPKGLCKHRLATYVSRRVCQLMAAPVLPSAPVATATAQEPGQAALIPVQQAALPEAPASANCHITIAGRQVQLTLRDSDEARLLQRLQAVLAQYPMPQPAPQVPVQGQGQDKSWCAKHQTTMQENHKDGRTWYSHRTDQGWCTGRARQGRD